MNQIKTRRSLQNSNSVALRIVAASSNADDRYLSGPISCIAENLTWMNNAETIDLRAIFVSPRGDVIVILRDSDVLELANNLAGKWNLSSLDDFCEKYTFQVYGQAFRVIDLLAKHGWLTFSRKSEFEKRISRNLESGRICFFISE